MIPEDQERLLAEIKKNKTEALKVVFDSFYPLVFHTTLRIVEDQALADDLAQEVFIKFWDKRQDLDIRFNLPAYLRKMAINQALAYLRSKKVRFSDELPVDKAAPASEKPDHLVLEQELSHLMEQAIDSLPERCKLVFRLSRFDGLSYQEIADAMEISIKTVENQMGKALKILREKLLPHLNKPA